MASLLELDAAKKLLAAATYNVAQRLQSGESVRADELAGLQKLELLLRHREECERIRELTTHGKRPQT